MGDLRSVYRFLAPALVQAGYGVATTDLRGHGESDATFAWYDDVATGTDVIALVHQLGGPAILVGNSTSAGAAALAPAEKPGLVAGLVLMAMARPWGPGVWNGYYRKLSRPAFGPRPAPGVDPDEHAPAGVTLAHSS